MDRNIKYLLLTIAIVLALAFIHNSVTFKGSYSLGYCNFSTYCKGINLGGTCLGIKDHNLKCTDPSNATEWMRAEAECAIQANPICREKGVEGSEWASKAEYKNKTCEEWGEEYKEITLINCNQAFGLAEDYKDLK